MSYQVREQVLELFSTSVELYVMKHLTITLMWLPLAELVTPHNLFISMSQSRCISIILTDFRVLSRYSVLLNLNTHTFNIKQNDVKINLQNLLLIFNRLSISASNRIFLQPSYTFARKL